MSLSMSVLRDGRSRSVSPENPTGGKGAGGGATTGTGAAAARDLGPGWKVSPSVEITAGGTHTVAEVAGPGVIRHMWLAVHPARLRTLVMRAYWDGAAEPAIAVPLGDLFCQGWASFAQVSSVPVAVNPHGGLNSYWEMPFRSQAKITLENLGQAAPVTVYYIPGTGYSTYTTPYLGLPQVLRPDGLYSSQQRFGMYRWHLPDPVRFSTDLRVTVQALGWRSGGRYLPLHDDIASTALWYQRHPGGLAGRS